MEDTHTCYQRETLRTTQTKWKWMKNSLATTTRWLLCTRWNEPTGLRGVKTTKLSKSSSSSKRLSRMQLRWQLQKLKSKLISNLNSFRMKDVNSQCILILSRQTKSSSRTLQVWTITIRSRLASSGNHLAPQTHNQFSSRSRDCWTLTKATRQSKAKSSWTQTMRRNWSLAEGLKQRSSATRPRSTIVSIRPWLTSWGSGSELRARCPWTNLRC